MKYDYIYNRITPLRRMHDENKFKANIYIHTPGTRISPINRVCPFICDMKFFFYTRDSLFRYKFLMWWQLKK